VWPHAVFLIRSPVGLDSGALCGSGSPLADEVEANPSARDHYKVQGIPALILPAAKELARHEGALAKPQLQAFPSTPSVTNPP